jgi:mRNA interferase RelE/StbE
MPSVYKELEKVPRKDQIKILKRINSLASNPRPYGYKRLINYDGYRVRQGDYRIVYTIHDKELLVWIVKVGNRQDVYRAREEKEKFSADYLKTKK